MNQYFESFADGLIPDPTFTLSEWADSKRIIPSKGAAEPGRWRTARTPYAREIMDCLSPSSPIQRIVFMKPTQVGGTEIGINWFGAIVDVWPAPVMIVQPTLDLAKRFSKQRIAPLIESMHELGAKIAPSRKKDSNNSILLKEFPGGVAVFSGSNSAVSLRQMPVKYLFADEISGYEPDADGEGDPVSLAEKRTETFGVSKKIFLNSTPKYKGTCRIEAEYENSDQRRYFVPCPNCGILQYLKWAQLKWIDGDPTTAHYICEANNCVIEEHHKTDMLKEKGYGGLAEWRPTAPCDNPAVRGYHINALYSPLGWKSWTSIAREWIVAHEKQKAGESHFLKTFINSSLAETWEESFSAKVGADGLKGRVETYEPSVAPARVLVLVAGADVQDDRIEISIYGFGREEESWLVSHVQIYGDPQKAEIWKQVDDVLLRPYQHELGGEIKIASTCIDSGGHATHQVYAYCRERKAHKIFAIKGASQRGKPAIGKPSKQDINYRGQIMKSGVDLYPVGTDTIKSALYGRFKIEVPGPGYVHFHSALGDDFFKQITAEKQITRHIRGYPVREWFKKPGDRNEALDCAVYAYAAMQLLYTRYHRKSIWDQLERALRIKGVPVPQPAAAPAVPEQPGKPAEDQKPEIVQGEKLKPQLPKRNIQLNRRNKGFVSNW